MFVNKNIPRISTRGRFDLLNGKPIAGRSPYTLYPARTFDAIYGSTEVTIMIHGLRNNSASAVEKFNIAKRCIFVHKHAPNVRYLTRMSSEFFLVLCDIVFIYFGKNWLMLTNTMPILHSQFRYCIPALISDVSFQSQLIPNLLRGRG